MKVRSLLGILTVICMGIAGCATTSKSTGREVSVAPDYFLVGYKDWTNTVAKVVSDKNSPFYGFQRVLVNDLALMAYKTGIDYPEGSVLVLEFNEPVAEDKDTVMGKTNWLAVMKRNPEAITGGWDFMAFDGKLALKTDINPVTGCYNCHTAQKSNNYIFSKYN